MNPIDVVDNDLDFGPIHKRMQWYVDQEILPCCNTLVMRGTDVLDFATFGYMDVEAKMPLTEDAIFRIYSNTKLVTSVAAMMLYERGAFGLDDALATYLPDFADMRVLTEAATSPLDTVAAGSQISIRQVMSHSAGLSYGFIEPESVIDRAYVAENTQSSKITLEELSAVLARLPLAYHPGSSWRYSFATDVLARLVEVWSGQSFDEFLNHNIFEPLGMADTGFWVPPEKCDRFTTMYAPEHLLEPMRGGLTKVDDAHDGVYTKLRPMLSGGAGLVSTVSDYLSFVRMLVSGGAWDGTQLLTTATLDIMRTNQLPARVGVNFPMWDMPGTVFGLGFALKETAVDNEPVAAVGEYHWGGIAGTHSWMSPAANLTGLCMTQRYPGFWHPFSHDFRSMAYEIAGG